MLIIRSLLLVLCVVGVTTVRASEREAPRALSPQEKATLHADEVVGRAMFVSDRAATVATDAALKLDAFRQESRVRGWITQAHADAVTVTFIDATPAALYRATVSNDGKLVGKVEAYATPLPLSAFEAGAVAARTVALGAKFPPCSARYNTVVLPLDASSAGKWLVYLLPATTQPSVIPIGGTSRVTVDHGTIVAQRPFTKSCIALENDPRAVALMISHLLDTTPTEAHVFWSLWAHKDMYVSTESAAWAIHDGRIRLVETGH
ncbi:hypothetical protein [Dyella sp.]|jgi:hypothetical protein|uniref:hypothetical protein n=1 Tax=Dyella sp. TaxID=1869338 RepID=UPI002D77A6B6|nr:hypothetical protein [Dyella sp.]HET6432652.1 hypothetical protein [Dyella sp.]